MKKFIFLLFLNLLTFLQAACASNSEFTSKTVDFLRESIAAFLESGVNLHSFHFNESLFQPFQTILCLELCGEDTFDRIVCAVAELVECHKKEINTGWKSLFGALKAVRCSYMFCKRIFTIFIAISIIFS